MKVGHTGRSRDLTAAVQPTPTGVSFSVRLTPKGGRDAIDGWIVGADGKRSLRVRVVAPPENGKANASLLALLARELHIARSKVSIRSGEAHRMKIIVAMGDMRDLAERLARMGEVS